MTPSRRRRTGKPTVELTYNWDPEEYKGGRNFGHLAYAVDDIYALCAKLQKAGVTINRPPRDGHMAFIRTPDLISIELIQKGELEGRRPNPGRRCRIPACGEASPPRSRVSRCARRPKALSRGCRGVADARGAAP